MSIAEQILYILKWFGFTSMSVVGVLFGYVLANMLRLSMFRIKAHKLRIKNEVFIHEMLDKLDKSLGQVDLVSDREKHKLLDEVRNIKNQHLH